jgi:hypothetical protein
MQKVSAIRAGTILWQKPREKREDRRENKEKRD